MYLSEHGRGIFLCVFIGWIVPCFGEWNLNLTLNGYGKKCAIDDENDSSTNSAYACIKWCSFSLVKIEIPTKFEAWLVAAGRAEGPAGAKC
jgi:hypothetical protein